ncbi:MAG: VOC family protein [Candidatus Aenigmarchaeota archaeon]|nr:VOC family protein [Candidatus Aenigmarchaeota archaeon]
MINHVTLLVGNFERSKEFYSRALRPLGYRLLEQDRKLLIAVFGIEDVEGKRDFCIKAGGVKQKTNSLSCLAFTASGKRMVNDFYRAAIKAGGKDNGAPGYRKKYHPGYYAAFVLDPDGNNIEAVFDDPDPAK